MSALIDQLIRHEGLRLKPYRDSVGKLTIGVGRNLDDVGINKDEAMVMLARDIERAYLYLKLNLKWFITLDEVRQDVLVNMCFNMGPRSLFGFKTTLALIEAGNFEAASRQMLKSEWAKQVGSRAKELAEQMRTGQYQV